MGRGCWARPRTQQATRQNERVGGGVSGNATRGQDLPPPRARRPRSLRPAKPPSCGRNATTDKPRATSMMLTNFEAQLELPRNAVIPGALPESGTYILYAVYNKPTINGTQSSVGLPRRAGFGCLRPRGT